MKEPRAIEVQQPEHVSVNLQVGHVGVANASIDHVVDHWWVSRVVVKEPFRRQGFGSRCLMRAVELVREMSSEPIVVAPGGYDVPYEVQRAFYARHDFVGAPGREMTWEGNSDADTPAG